mgnify:CR=1 FL=1
MTYTAIYWSTVSDELSRSITFYSSHNRKDAWEVALEKSADHEWETLVCLLPGSHEAWSPDVD